MISRIRDCCREVRLGAVPCKEGDELTGFNTITNELEYWLVAWVDHQDHWNSIVVRYFMNITGEVIVAPVSQGSKSEHNAVMINTTEGNRYTLRFPDGNPFQDDRLEVLVGKTVTLIGTVYRNIFMIEEVLPELPKEPKNYQRHNIVEGDIRF